MHRPLVVAACALVALACDSKKLTEPAAEPAPTAATKLQTSINPSVKRLEGVTAMIAGAAPHNPRSQAGSLLICFDGVTDGGFGGTCQRFLPTKDGAELKTNGGHANGEYAGVFASPVNIRGKLLGAVQELRFSYAGGPPSGGSPRWSVAIDENNNFRHDATEVYAFTDANSHCNDGDGFVGTVDAEDDGTCTWFHRDNSYPNWDSFAGAHPTFRIAQRHADGSGGFIPAFIITDQPAHTLIWGVVVN